MSGQELDQHFAATILGPIVLSIHERLITEFFDKGQSVTALEAIARDIHLDSSFISAVQESPLYRWIYNAGRLFFNMRELVDAGRVAQLHREIFIQNYLGVALYRRGREINWNSNVSGFNRYLSLRGRIYCALHLEDILSLLTPWYVVRKGALGLVSGFEEAIKLLGLDARHEHVMFYGSVEDATALLAEFENTFTPISRKIEIMHEAVTHWEESRYKGKFIEHLKWLDSVLAEAISVYGAG
ncbi:MAG: hypothetical protein MUO21_03890 [Nitrososphaeraceae archaeon]|nr:hypothetical protein [Nitrososphaeraceae archaeon]